ncbi:MAG TPA: Gfo/Idh/MocA family oxidoreductase, partial [Methylomirabilota bacterium]|nr:Gfo/Idh/MocA family oxidoreductase [Methylomirabilota bacterium]
VIATSNPERQAQAAAEHPGASVVGSVDELLASADVELVVVVTPNRSHVPVGIRALEAGRHVVVDKPIAMDVPEAETLLNAAERSGRILSVYQNRRGDGDFLTVRSLLEGGVLGEIDSLEARFERWGAVGDQWRETAEEAGGPLRDLGAHLVDQSLVLFGDARRVFAQMDSRRRGSRVDDSTFVAIDHVDGVRSRLWSSLIAARTGPRFRIRGLGGEFVKDDLDPQEDQLLGGLRPDDPGFGEDPPERWGRVYASDGSFRTVATQRGDYRWFYERFRDAIRGVGERPVDPLDSIRGLRVLEAAEESARTGAVVTVSDA